eukprot:GILK01003063.1.p1 GENE.GILK01003063.1~~GILK01003063.1.p1  ORF type:complete len:263 (-),score=64.42 GILK01003063.1:48-797(-)
MADELSAFLNEISSIAQRDAVYTAESQIPRLLDLKDMKNPYEILILSFDATADDIKKQYRKLSILVHPDKCRDERAPDAFHVLEQAYKELTNPEKKQIHERVIREGRERADNDIKRENKKRAKEGQPLYSSREKEELTRQTVNDLYAEIETRKKNTEKREAEKTKRERAQEVSVKVQARAKHEHEKAWEETRDNRMSSWRSFANNPSKRAKIGITKPAKLKVEERPASAPKVETTKPMGVNEEYKKNWR